MSALKPESNRLDSCSKVILLEAIMFANERENMKLINQLGTKDATINLLNMKIRELNSNKNNEAENRKLVTQLAVKDAAINLLNKKTRELNSSKNRQLTDLLQHQKKILEDSNKKSLKICEILKNNESLKDQLGALQNQSRMDAMRHAEHLVKTEPWRLHQSLAEMDQNYQEVINDISMSRTNEVISLHNQIQALRQELLASNEKAQKRGRHDQDEDKENLGTRIPPNNKRIKSEKPVLLKTETSKCANVPSLRIIKPGPALTTKLSRDN